MVIAAKLAFQKTVHPLDLLLFAKLHPVAGKAEGQADVRSSGKPVHPLDLLLFAKLHPVAGKLHPSLAMLPRWIGSPLDGALIGVAAIPLQIHLEVFSTTDAANTGGVTCQ